MKRNGTTTAADARRGGRWSGLCAVAALGACWTTPQAPTTSSPSAIPGLLWITPVQPWRMTHHPMAIAPDGDTALVGGTHGWIARVDLRTGAIQRERRVSPGLVIHGIARLRDGRWIAVGVERDRTIAAIVDGETLETRSIALGAVPDRGFSSAGVAVLPDGGVVIAGKGLPLAIYEPRTWKIRTVIASELGWNKPTLRGSMLAISRGNSAFAFDLSTGPRAGTRTAVGSGSGVQAAGARAALMVYDKGKWFAEVWEAGTQRGRVGEPIETFALDATRLVTGAHGKLDVYTLAPGMTSLGPPTSRIDLGPAGRGATHQIVLDGDRAFVVSAQMLRVVDLRTGKVTSGGDAPWDTPIQLAVGTDGTVLDLGNSFVWRIAGGRVTATGELGDGEVLVMQPHDVSQFAVRAGRTITVHALVGGATKTWTVPQDPLQGWLGRANIVIDTLFESDQPSRLYRSEGPTLDTVIGYTGNADVSDVDPDGGDALIMSGGRVHVVRTQRGTVASHTLLTPNCGELASAELERGGTRATTYDGRNLAVWDRSTGVLLGTARFDEDITRTMFVAGRDELVVGLASGIALLSPGREMRFLPLPDHAVGEVSSDGRRLAIGFGNGRVALVDLDALRARLPPEPTRDFAMPTDCKADDPFKVAEPTKFDQLDEADID